jgi:chaperonin cofactor prefoldin
MSKLYEISEQYQELAALADSDDENMKEAVETTLECIAGDFNEKAQALVTVVHNMDSDVEAIDAEIKRLQARKTAIKNRQDSMRDYLRENMERTGIKKISCPLFTINCVAGREIAVINDESVIPDEYMAVKTEIRPDKSAIAKALKAGAEIPGVSLDRAKSSIRIK